MSVPLCRCRVLYIGSAVPTITKDGLQGIQQPLKERYALDNGAEVKGVDSWLSVWSNGILLEYIDGSKSVEQSFFPIQTLHYCAAVRYIQVNSFTLESQGRFLPLDAPMAQPNANPNNSNHPPMFAAIFRKQTGVKVLECHAFICTSDRAANSLVRCCFHSYADTMYIRINERNSRALKDRSRSESPAESEQQASELEPLSDDQQINEQDWQDRAIDRKTWQWRQNNDDATSMLSSVYVKRSPKKTKKLDTQSEVYEDRAVVPFAANNRRAGSQTDVRVNGVQQQQEETYYTFSGGPPGATFVPPQPPATPGARRGPRSAVPPPPPHFMPFPMPPPAFFKSESRNLCQQPALADGRCPPPPPHFYGPFPPPPPPPPHFFPVPPPGAHRHSSMPPPHLAGRYGFPPPHIFPGFFPPPPPHFAYPRPRSPAAGDGPIITEAIYDTYPRRAYDEHVYGTNGTTRRANGGPTSPTQQYYESYYDTYKSRQKKESRSDSDTSVDDSQFWEAYEAGAYKRPAQRADSLGSGVHNRVKSASTFGVDKSPALSRIHGVHTVQSSSDNSTGRRLDHSTPKVERRHARPATPPADYERNSVLIEQGTQIRQAAVF